MYKRPRQAKRLPGLAYGWMDERKHIYFIAETKGTLEGLSLKPIEKARISCARKLFNEISTENVKYHDVDSDQHLLDVGKAL